MGAGVTLGGVQVGFNGQPVATEVLLALKGLGVELIRCDAEAAPDDATTRAIAQGVIDAGMVPYLTLSRPEQAAAVPAGTHVSPLNEPEKWGYLSRPLAYRDLVVEMRSRAADGVMVWGGCTMNTRQNNFDWLAATQPQTWAFDVGVDLHRYPPDGWPSDDVRTPHPGFADRDAEMARLKQIIGNRSWGVSEFGFHTAARKLWGWFWFYQFRWTDEQIAPWVEEDMAFFERHGAAAVCLYQYIDGPQDIAEHRRGIRRLNTDGTPGDWKPVAAVFAKRRQR